MEKTIKIEVPAAKAAEIQAEIRYYLNEIEQAHKRMKKDRPEIERLKAKTRSILAQLRAA